VTTSDEDRLNTKLQRPTEAQRPLRLLIRFYCMSTCDFNFHVPELLYEYAFMGSLLYGH